MRFTRINKGPQRLFPCSLQTAQSAPIRTKTKGFCLELCGEKAAGEKPAEAPARFGLPLPACSLWNPWVRPIGRKMLVAGIAIAIAMVLFANLVTLKRRVCRELFSKVEFGMRSNKVFAVLGPPSETYHNSALGDSWTYRSPWGVGCFVAFTTNGVVNSIVSVEY